MLLSRYHQWKRRRATIYAERASSWLNCSGEPERTVAQRLRALRLYKFLTVCFDWLPYLRFELLATVVAPQSKDRFWNGLPVRLRPGWIFPVDDLQSFLTDSTSLKLRTPTEVLLWLRNCRYEPDESRFGKRDHWQKPSEFEKAGRGDCEDHALWAWCQLHRMRVDARFVVGLYRRPVRRTLHAWVTLPWQDGLFLLDGTGGNERNLLDEETARKLYLPLFSVDGKGRLYWHG